MNDHSGIAYRIQRCRPAVIRRYPTAPYFHTGFQRSGLDERSPHPRRIAGCPCTPHSILRLALLLLRLQHGGDARLQQTPALSGYLDQEITRTAQLVDTHR